MRASFIKGEVFFEVKEDALVNGVFPLEIQVRQTLGGGYSLLQSY